MEDDVQLTLDHLKLAMGEIAKTKGITPERAVYEHLCEASTATTVDDEGRVVPDLITRATASRLMREFGFTSKLPKGGSK